MLSEARPCPFCKSENLDASMKVSSASAKTRKYHYTVYCKSCNAYGPRVLVKLENKPYTSREELANNPEAIRQAIEAWNNR